MTLILLVITTYSLHYLALVCIHNGMNLDQIEMLFIYDKHFQKRYLLSTHSIHIHISIPNRLFRMCIEKEIGRERESESDTDKTLIRLYQLIIDAINIFSKSDSWWQSQQRILLYIKWQQCKFNIHGYIVLNFLPDWGKTQKLLICSGWNALFSLA